MLRKWIRKRAEYQENWRQGQRRATTGRHAELPELEQALREKFVQVRRKGYKVKRPWFVAQGRDFILIVRLGVNRLC